MNGTMQQHRFVNGSGGQTPPAFQRGDHHDVDLAVSELQAWCREVGQLGCPKINELGNGCLLPLCGAVPGVPPRPPRPRASSGGDGSQREGTIPEATRRLAVFPP